MFQYFEMKMKQTNNYNVIGAHSRALVNKVGQPLAPRIVHKCMHPPKEIWAWTWVSQAPLNYF